MVALPQTSGVFDRTVHPSELHVPVPGSGAVTSATVVAVVGMIVVAVVTALLAQHLIEARPVWSALLRSGVRRAVAVPAPPAGASGAPW